MAGNLKSALLPVLQTNVGYIHSLYFFEGISMVFPCKCPNCRLLGASICMYIYLLYGSCWPLHKEKGQFAQRGDGKLSWNHNPKRAA